MKDILITLLTLFEFKVLIKDLLREVIREELVRSLSDAIIGPVTAEQFCKKLGYMALSTFYQKAPKGEIPGAFKVGSRWFIDLQEFEKVSKNVNK